WVPGPSALDRSSARPLESSATALPCGAPSSPNCTLPEGTALTSPLITVAMKVTGSPATDGFDDASSVVAVSVADGALKATSSSTIGHPPIGSGGLVNFNGVAAVPAVTSVLKRCQSSVRWWVPVRVATLCPPQ